VINDTIAYNKISLTDVLQVLNKILFSFAKNMTSTTRAEQLLRWATVPEQSRPKSGGAAVPLSVEGNWVPI